VSDTSLSVSWYEQRGYSGRGISSDSFSKCILHKASWKKIFSSEKLFSFFILQSSYIYDIVLFIIPKYRFNIRPYPDINFGSLGIYSQEAKYLKIENTGQFPLHYSIRKRKEYVGNPSLRYMPSIKIKDVTSKDLEKMTDVSTRKNKIVDKRLAQTEKSSVTQFWKESLR